MELACDIIRRKDFSINPSLLLSEIKKLGISFNIKNNNPKNFKKVVKTYLPYFDNLAKYLFNKDNKDLGYALLLTYYISEYPTKILYSNLQKKQNYSSFQTKLNDQDKHEIVNAANRVILFLEGVNDNIDKFYDAVDYYYALYKIWTSDDLYRINNLFHELYKLCSHKDNRYKSTIINILDKMFSLNTKMTIQILLENYKHFVINKVITNYIWNTIKKISTGTINQESCDHNVDSDIQHIILIMITRLRIELISLLSNSADLKDIYYKIDTENIIRNIRNYKFNQSEINYIINILISKINKLYPTSNIPYGWVAEQADIPCTPMTHTIIHKYYNDVFSIFKSMFKILY
uniref:Uncharacterized protein n=1 Tax=Mimivirus LCMiAC02 TaxID=2506609 RepID=A0A481Z0Y7_9VIRU|nr:MAG: hypothetical protein LCMiAC02_02560 [Mimivirus LCMiAC02]